MYKNIYVGFLHALFAPSSQELRARLGLLAKRAPAAVTGKRDQAAKLGVLGLRERVGRQGPRACPAGLDREEKQEALEG